MPMNDNVGEYDMGRSVVAYLWFYLAHSYMGYYFSLICDFQIQCMKMYLNNILDQQSNTEPIMYFIYFLKL